MLRAALASLLAVADLASCGPPPEDTTPPWRPDATLQEPPASDDPLIILTDDAAAMLEDIRGCLGGDSLRPLARLANSQPGFMSNFGGERHFEHWYVLRRTGVDPLKELATLLNQPGGTMKVGAETWYIWPDLAALPPEALASDQLAPRDRVRLRELVGEEGLAQIRAGSPYPGFRTAISSTGRWLYYLHETGEAGEQ